VKNSSVAEAEFSDPVDLPQERTTGRLQSTGGPSPHLVGSGLAPLFRIGLFTRDIVTGRSEGFSIPFQGPHRALGEGELLSLRESPSRRQVVHWIFTHLKQNSFLQAVAPGRRFRAVFLTIEVQPWCSVVTPAYHGFCKSPKFRRLLGTVEIEPMVRRVAPLFWALVREDYTEGDAVMILRAARRARRETDRRHGQKRSRLAIPEEGT